MNSAVKLLDAAAEKYGEKVALRDAWGEISFFELQKRAKCVASALLAGESRSGISPIIVYMKKSIRCIVSFMGILYSGNPYVPVAADIPATRLEKIIENTAPSFIITDDEGLKNLEGMNLHSAKICLYDDLLKCTPDESLISLAVSGVIDTDPIYIMYTSGSTGVPKGVTVPHRGVIDYVSWTSREFSITSADVLGNQAPFYFDNSIFDIYGCLITGAEMVIIPEPLFNFPVKLPEFLKEYNITMIFWVPTVIIHIANSGILSGFSLPTLRAVLFCGEVMPNTQLNIWRKALPDILYANLYGPTEITDVCTFYIVDRDFEDHEPLPIGRACPNMRAVIIGEDGKAASWGEKGELCIMGTGVALGYWNAPDITDKVFIQNPLNTSYRECLYRTGDLAYIDKDGLIIYAGRMDTQIKLKGNRIELGDVESAAMCVPGVLNACALFDSENEKIVLFVESSSDLQLRTINLELRKYIPKYMLPGELRVMDKLPHTANDKIDRVKLRATLK